MSVVLMFFDTGLMTDPRGLACDQMAFVSKLSILIDVDMPNGQPKEVAGLCEYIETISC